MKHSVAKTFMQGLLMAGLAFTTVACSDNDAEEAGEEIEEMVDDTGDAISDAADDAGDAVEEACEDIKDGVDAEDRDC